MSNKSFKLAVSALINDGEGRYLLLKRAAISERFAGQWEPPGGKIDPGETFDVALLREVREETGLSVVLDEVAGITEFSMPKFQVALIYMKAHAVSGNLQLSEEHEDFVWLRPEEFNSKELTPKLADCKNLKF